MTIASSQGASQEPVARGQGPVASGQEPVRVITVRLPKSLHERLREAAYQQRTSMNQLCIERLAVPLPVLADLAGGEAPPWPPAPESVVEADEPQIEHR